MKLIGVQKWYNQENMVTNEAYRITKMAETGQKITNEAIHAQKADTK
jgi:hypothetical protein